MTRFSNLEKLAMLLILLVAGMIMCRVVYAGSLMYVFLLWNIFLAWIPFKLSLGIGRQSNRWLSALIFMSWLLFFPNALYIITDLIHLEERTNVPLLYDALMLYSSATTGLLLAFTSLYKIELFLCSRFKSNAANKIAIVLLFLGSFGVYAGRFLRWNSWDIVTDPFILTTAMGKRFLYPHLHTHTWSITLILTLLFSILYFSFRELPKFLQEKAGHDQLKVNAHT